MDVSRYRPDSFIILFDSSIADGESVETDFFNVGGYIADVFVG